MHAACMWSRDAEVKMPWEGEAGTGRWHGGDAAWGQLAVRSLGPAPAGPCCASVPTGASPAPCSHTRPWHQLSTPGLALRGRAPQEPTRLRLWSCCPAQGELRLGALPAGPQPLAPLGAVLQGAHPVGKAQARSIAPLPSPVPELHPPRCQHSPSFSSQPSRSGLKKVWVRSLPSSSGILKGSFLMLS